MKLVQPRPQQLGAKVTDIEQVLRPVLHHVTGASLRLTTATSMAAGLISLSAVALHKWMRKLGPYLAELLMRLLGTEQLSPERWAGYRLVAADATTVQRPGALGVTARVHYALTLPDLRCKHCEVTDDKGGETARRFVAEEGELWLLDRGYANPPGVAWMAQQGAAVIVRYCRGSLPLFDTTGHPIDVDELVCSTVGHGGEWERGVFVHGPDDKVIEGRLCWTQLPDDKAEQARERLRREHDGSVDAMSLQMAGFVVLFTTAPAERLDTGLVLALYRARWQIELEFKRDKSIGDLGRLPNFRPDTIHSWICAHLLLQEIVRKIATTGVAFPPGAFRNALLLPPLASGPRALPDGARALVYRESGLGRRARGRDAHRSPRPPRRSRSAHRAHPAIQRTPTPPAPTRNLASAHPWGWGYIPEPSRGRECPPDQFIILDVLG